MVESKRGEHGEIDTLANFSTYPFHVVRWKISLASKGGRGTGAIRGDDCLVFVHLTAKSTPNFEGRTSSQVVCLVASNAKGELGAKLDTLK